MYRTHTCGELQISDVNKVVTLSGWVQRSRKMGGMTFIDLRDRYGITQLVFNDAVNAELCDAANKLGREFVIQVKGEVNERSNKNANLSTGDVEIIVSELEHHSNIVPWQLAQEKFKFKIKVLPFKDNGELDLEVYKTLLNSKTKLVSVAHVSNALGTINPIKEIIELAHKQGVPVLIDGAQGVPHFKVDVQELDCDFYVFSGHKMYAPMGIGVLYGKREYLEQMPPYHGGGEMIKEVSFECTTFNEIPFKFEAGTPSVSDVLGLKAAIEYIDAIGYDFIQKHEDFLMEYTTKRLLEIEGIKIYGTSKHKSGSVSFNLKDVHPFDIGTLLDQLGIAIRTGHHCAQTVMQHYGIVGTARVSFGVYNTKEEIDYFIESLKKVKTMLS